MVNPGAFKGLRREFLLGEKEAYEKGVLGGYAADALANIQRRYFKRFPIDLPHDEEPTQEHLGAVDDDAPDIELPELDETAMTPEELQEELARRQARQKLIEFRKAQIKRRMAYQYMKDHDLDPRDSGALNPFRPLLFKLTGQTGIRPRCKTALNVWRVAHRAEIEEELKKQIAADQIPRQLFAKHREKIAKDMFDQLSKEDKDGWEVQVAEEHAIRLEKWEQVMKGEISTSPQDRQKCIQGLVQFMQPVLDLVCQATGWHATLITGGPEPAHGGRLNVVSLHSGTTAGDVKMNFGRAERRRYKDFIVPIYGNYLKKCFSPAECQSRALAEEDGFSPLDETDMEETGATTNVLDVAKPTDMPSPGTTSTSTLCNGNSSVPSAPLSKVPSTTTAPTEPHTPTSYPPLPSTSRSSSPPPSRPPSLPPSRPPSPAPSPAPSLPPSPVIAGAAGIQCSSEPVGTPAVPPTLAVNDGSNVSTVRVRSADSNEDASSRPLRSNAKRPQKRSRVEEHTSASTLIPNSHPNKRRKATSKALSTPSASETVVGSTAPSLSLPSDVEPWFTKAMEMLQCGDDLGPRWRHLLEVWMAFEQVSGYHEVRKLKTTHRPQCIADWIQRARSLKWRPNLKVISNVSYIQQVLKWWTVLQPEWRLTGDGKIDFSLIDGDWEHLRLPGLNGLHSFVASLFYGGIGSKENDDAKVQWLLLVEDFISVCSRLAK